MISLSLSRFRRRFSPSKMNGGPSGFNNAPVTRIFVIACALLTILSGVRGRSLRLGLSYQDIFQKFRLWKLISSVLAFSSTPELMFGGYLIYYFRVFERQIGSKKHTVFILFSVVVSLLIEVLAIAYLRDPSSTLASGPYSLIFASFVPFYSDIPVSSRFRIFGIQLTDKSFVYMAGLQLLFSSWKRSLVPGICGVLAGSLYRLNVFGIRKIKIPDFVTSFFSRSSRPSSGTSHNLRSRTTMQNVPSYSSRQVEGFQGSFPSAARESVQGLSEASVATLVSMGFDTSSSRQALMQARNDVHVATNILLESQSQ